MISPENISLSVTFFKIMRDLKTKCLYAPCNVNEM